MTPWLTVPLTVARQHLPPQPESDPSAPDPFAFADRDRVSGILTRAGYSAIDIARHDTSARICGPGEAEQAAYFATYWLRVSGFAGPELTPPPSFPG